MVAVLGTSSLITGRAGWEDEVVCGADWLPPDRADWLPCTEQPASTIKQASEKANQIRINIVGVAWRVRTVAPIITDSEMALAHAPLPALRATMVLPPEVEQTGKSTRNGMLASDEYRQRRAV